MTDSEASTGIEMASRKKGNEKTDHDIKLLDPVQNAMGPLGHWHIWVCAVIFLLKFPVAWHQIGIIFLAPPVDIIGCGKPDNSSLDYCLDECEEVKYDTTTFNNTIIMEWRLICDRGHFANLSQTIFMLGILCGNIIFGIWADKSGRRIPLVAAVIIQLISGVGTAFVPDFWMFCVLRFITALATGGTMVTSFVLVMEIIGVKWRELFSVLYQIPFNVGHLTLSLFGYYFRDWRVYQFAISIPSIVLISYYWLIPESPRWLFTAGKLKESAAVLEKAAKQNKLPTEHILSDLEESSKRKDIENKDRSKGNMFDLFRTPNLRVKTVCICFNWFVCGLSFFGVAQYMGQIGGDIFVNVAVGAAVEIPGTIICILLMKYWGRRKTLMASNTLSGLAMLCIAFVPKELSKLVVTLSSIGIIGMSISFPTVYLYGGEIFPTVVRNVGIGLASMIARVGSMLAPFVTGLGDTHYVLPPIIYGVIPIIGAALVWFLPETRGEPLPETIKDGEEFGKRLKSNNIQENGK